MTSPIKNNIGILLEQKGKTIADLARHLGLSYRSVETLVLLESLTSVNLYELHRVSDFLDVTVDSLYLPLPKKETEYFVIGEYSDLVYNGSDKQVLLRDSIRLVTLKALLKSQAITSYIEEQTGDPLYNLPTKVKVDLVLEFYKSSNFEVKHFADPHQAWHYLEKLKSKVHESLTNFVATGYNIIDDKLMTIISTKEVYVDKIYTKLKNTLVGEYTIAEFDKQVSEILGANRNLTGSVATSFRTTTEDVLHFVNLVIKGCDGSFTNHPLPFKLRFKSNGMLQVKQDKK